jgi:hypothetical protein
MLKHLSALVKPLRLRQASFWFIAQITASLLPCPNVAVPDVDAEFLLMKAFINRRKLSDFLLCERDNGLQKQSADKFNNIHPKTKFKIGELLYELKQTG